MRATFITSICIMIIAIMSPLADASPNPARQAKMKAQLKARFDKDKDGKLSPSEREELKKYRQSVRDGKRPKPSK